MSIRQPYPVSSGGSGDVVGPASSTNNNVVFFNGTTGKLIKDSGLTLSGSNTGDQVITSSDSSLTVSTNNIVLNVGHANTWTALQAFNSTKLGINGTVTGTKLITTASTTGGSWLVPGTGSDVFVGEASSATLTNKTLTSPTLTTPSAFTTGGTITLAENTSIALDPAGSADGKYSGITVTGTAGTALAFGDLVYLAAADSRWELADANAASTSGDVMLGMCVLAAAGDGSATNILLHGIIRADAAFPALTISAQVYASTTAGDIQVAQPSGTDDVIRVVGRALTADEIYFHPSEDYVTHT